MPLKGSLKRISQRLIRIKKTSQPEPTASIPKKPTPVSSHAVGSLSLVAAQHGDFRLPDLGGPKALGFSVASYQANDPFLDKHILQMDTSGPLKHMFAMVVSSTLATQNAGQYMYRAFYTELMCQIRSSNDVGSALQLAFACLDRKFQSLHQFNAPLVDGARFAVIYVDLATYTLYAISSGGNWCAVGKTASAAAGQGGSSQGAFVGAQARQDKCPAVHVEKLTPQTQSLVVASHGFWAEVTPDTAALRLHSHQQRAPQASSGNAAAQLAWHALNAVQQRAGRMEDPRMRSLNSLEALQSLWVGSKANYKWAGKQPVRRRRGDVHGDLTVLVISLDWIGRVTSFSKQEGKRGKMPRVRSSEDLPRLPASRHWDTVRMHFLQYARESRLRTRQRWWTLVDTAMRNRPQPISQGVPVNSAADVCAQIAYSGAVIAMSEEQHEWHSARDFADAAGPSTLPVAKAPAMVPMQVAVVG